MSNRVTCIKKSDRTSPYERITHIGGINANGQSWRITQAEAIRHIESGEYEFHVRVAGNHIVNVIVAVSRFGNKYIKTTADGEDPNNLLSLPECH